MFTHEDSKWVEMVLDEIPVIGDARDREARFVVRAVGEQLRACSQRSLKPTVHGQTIPGAKASAKRILYRCTKSEVCLASSPWTLTTGLSM